MSKTATRFLALFLTLAMLLPNLLPVSAAEVEPQTAAVQSSEEANKGTPSEGTPEGTPAGKSEGSSEGTPAGGSEGSSEGTPAGGSEGSSEGTPGEDGEKDSEDDSNENPVTHSEITSLTFDAAPEPEQPVDGLIAVTPGTSDPSGDFTVTGATAIRVDGTLYATLTVSTAYTHLYFGSKAELDAKLAAGEAFSALPSPFHFTSSAGDNSRLTVCAVKADEAIETGYAVLELELVIPQIPVPEAKITPVPTPNSYPAAPSAEQDMSGKLFVAKQGADAVYPMFKIESATAVKDDKQIYVTVQVNAAASGTFTYSYLYFGTRTALAEQLTKGGPFDVVAGVNGEKQSYHFTQIGRAHV